MKRQSSGHRKSRQNARIRRTVPTVYYSLLSSPIGKIGVAATRQGICRISLNETSIASFRNRILKEYSCTAIQNKEFFKTLSPKMRAYFSGQGLKSKNSIDLLVGTRFQQRVWRALRSIPYGQTRSYRSIAESIGHPKSSRAVGTACGRNPLPILIPCHRVVKADGQLGGFTGGLGLKRHLLNLEGVQSTLKRP